MILWTDIEFQAVANFVAASDNDALKAALIRFTNELASSHEEGCTQCMASVPRDPERAADHAAKAQILNEFWTLLFDELKSFARPSQEPTLQGVEE